jgi:glycosyltransferase involved in cell wall biosynthesis
MKQAALYICYYNVTEPLVETQVMAYLRELSRRGFKMHLLTFEREQLTARERRAIRRRMDEAGISWHALRYHQRPSLPATLYDIFAGSLAALIICRKHNVKLVHARSHVPAAMALMLKRLLGCRFLFDLRGLMAEEYVDAGHWSEGDIKYRLTKRMERQFFKRADAFVMLTDRIKRELVESEPSLSDREADIQVIPCCVDTARFDDLAAGRTSYRRARGWDDRLVLTYVGKLGTWYLPDEMARFFRAAHDQDGRFFFQVLTQSDAALIEQALIREGVGPQDYDIRFATPAELPQILAASDAGLSFIRESYSKRASSPTKVAEYLAAGLPVIASRGIGDCDRMLEDHRLGLVIRDFTEGEYRQAVNGLRLLLEDESTPSRCREFAEKHLSLSSVGGPRYASVYERLLGRAARVAAQESLNAAG